MSAVRAERIGWRDDAACATYPGEWWFPENQEQRRSARAICRTCTVREDCLEDAIAGPADRGIRAGYTPNQIARIKKGRKAA